MSKIFYLIVRKENGNPNYISLEPNDRVVGIVPFSPEKDSIHNIIGKEGNILVYQSHTYVRTSDEWVKNNNSSLGFTATENWYQDQLDYFEKYPADKEGLLTAMISRPIQAQPVEVAVVQEPTEAPPVEPKKLISSVKKEFVRSEQVTFVEINDEDRWSLIIILKEMLDEFKEVKQRNAVDAALFSLRNEDFMPTKVALNLQRMLKLRMKHCTQVLADIHTKREENSSSVICQVEEEGLAFGMFKNTSWIYLDKKPWNNLHHNTATMEFMQYCVNAILLAVTNIGDELED